MEEYITTNTVNGKIKGLVTSIQNRKVNVFHRVPFAKPPIGKLRFMPPERADPWDGVRNGTKPGPMPWQNMSYYNRVEHFFPYKADMKRSEANMSEDCLYASIYAPQSADRKLPVMLWFYGGSFVMGSSLPFDGTVLSGLNDVIVVVPNYRLGIFGFLSMGEKSGCRGNAGLLDQVMIMRWVRENIASFGGDANNVTIFGSSAGGMSVGYHLLSEVSRGLFHKAISCSGNAATPLLSLHRNDWETKLNALCRLMDCDNMSQKSTLQYLQSVSAKSLSGTSILLTQRKMNFGPVYDGHFFHDKFSFYNEVPRPVSRVPYLIGCNNHDGASTFTVKNFTKGLTEEEMIERWQVSLRLFFPKLQSNSVIQPLMEFYANKITSKQNFSEMDALFYTDLIYKLPALYVAKAHIESGGEVYIYDSEYQFQYNHDNSYGPNTGKKPDWIKCDHGDDVFMTFGMPLATYKFMDNKIKFTKEEIERSKEIMTYFTNFAKHGNPNNGKEVATRWQRYDIVLGNHLKIKNKEVTNEGKMSEDIMLLWKRFDLFLSKL